jgi:Recombinase
MELIPERAEVDREIFRMAAAGIGAQIIAQKLNNDSKRYLFFSQHEYEGKGKRWIKSRVEKILRHPATFGGFQPQTKTRTGRLEPDGELVHGFYPAVVTLAEFKDVQIARASRIRKQKGSSTAAMSNLFAGIVYDATLKLPMNYQR